MLRLPASLAPSITMAIAVTGWAMSTALVPHIALAPFTLYLMPHSGVMRPAVPVDIFPAMSDLVLGLDLQLHASMGAFGLEYDLTRVFALVIAFGRPGPFFCFELKLCGLEL